MKSKTGDAVKFSRIGGSLRMDRTDAEELQLLIHATIARALGGLIGVTSGALTPIAFDTTNVAAVAVGECALFWAYPAGGANVLRNPEGMVVRHIPSLPSQSSTVNLSAYVAGEGKPFIWARRLEVEGTPAARRKWVVTEVSDNTNSRYEERVGFAVAMTNPDPAEGWFRFARVTSWSAGKPVITPVSPWDMLDIGLEGRGFKGLRKELEDLKSFGLAGVMMMVTQQLARIMDSRWKFAYDTTDSNVIPTSQPELGPFDDPPKGLRQLYVDDVDMAGKVATLYAAPELLGWGSVLGIGTFDASEFMTYAEAPAPNSDSTGVYNLYVKGRAQSVQVTPWRESGSADRFQAYVNSYNEETQVSHIAVLCWDSAADGSSDPDDLRDGSFFINVWGARPT